MTGGRRAQTGESWNTVVKPKALGAWNLDAATRGLADLEQFVVFSSVVATLGNAGAAARHCPAHSPLAALCCLCRVGRLAFGGPRTCMLRSLTRLVWAASAVGT
jgi:hypothetical protein